MMSLSALLLDSLYIKVWRRAPITRKKKETNFFITLIKRKSNTKITHRIYPPFIMQHQMWPENGTCEHIVSRWFVIKILFRAYSLRETETADPYIFLCLISMYEALDLSWLCTYHRRILLLLFFIKFIIHINNNIIYYNLLNIRE